MKSIHRLIYAVVTIAIVVSLLSFKTKAFGQGIIYCDGFCSSWNRIDWKPSIFGTVSDPCQNGPKGEYLLTPDNTCVQLAQGTLYTPTPP